MAFELIAGALIGFGAAEFLTSSGEKTRTPEPIALPNQKTAGQDASQAVNDQRKKALATGGLTDYTGGSGILFGSDVHSVSLVGN